VLVGKENVDVIFTEFPALLFISIYSLIVIRWAEVWYYTSHFRTIKGYSKFQFYLILLNGTIYVAFIILIAVFFSLHNSQVVSCVHPNGSKSAQYIVAIIYKIYFLILSIGLIIGFLVYRSMITYTLSKTTMTTKGEHRTWRFLKLGAVTIICSMCLLAQAINMIVGSFDSNRPLTFLLIFTLVTEIVPSIIFIILWSNATVFIIKSTSGTTGISIDESQTKSNTRTSDPKEEVTSTPSQNLISTNDIDDENSSEMETVSLAAVPKLDDSDTISVQNSELGSSQI